MKQAVSFLLITLFVLACCHPDSVAPGASKCIIKKIKKFKREFKDCRECFIETAQYQGATVFVFDQGSAFDAPVFVLNNACDTLGSWGGRRFSQFRVDFEENATDRKKIWP